jgi:hypothetical protein
MTPEEMIETFNQLFQQAGLPGVWLEGEDLNGAKLMANVKKPTWQSPISKELAVLSFRDNEWELVLSAKQFWFPGELAAPSTIGLKEVVHLIPFTHERLAGRMRGDTLLA